MVVHSIWLHLPVWLELKAVKAYNKELGVLQTGPNVHGSY